MISLENISKSYGELQVFKNLSLKIPYGKSLMVMGRSGCGKTTLLRLLMGLEKPDSGQIKGIHSLKISAVFQENRLVPQTTVFHNLSLVCSGKSSDKQSHAAISHILTRLDLGNISGEYVENLSGGMARRVAIARALLTDFDLLILDEPFHGLDEKTKETTAKFILESTKGKTLIGVSHQKEDASLLQIEKIYNIWKGSNDL